MKTYVVSLLGDRLSLHVHVDAPQASMGLRVLERDSHGLGRRRPALAVGAGEGGVPAHEIHLLVSDVAEIHQDALGRVPAEEVFVQEAVDSAIGGCAVVVMTDVLAKESVFVAQTVRKALRFRVKENEIGVKR